jgi:hypothetical protein
MHHALQFGALETIQIGPKIGKLERYNARETNGENCQQRINVYSRREMPEVKKANNFVPHFG